MIEAHKSIFKPNDDHKARVERDAVHKDDALFTRFAIGILAPVLTPSITNDELKARLDTVWKFWIE